MSYVSVEDGVYTGVQVHSSPELRELLQYVPKHKAPFIVLEVKGGAVIDEIQTSQSLVSFNKAKGTARQFLADNGIGVVDSPTAQQLPTGNKELDILKAQNDELRALVEKLLQAKAPEPAPAPAHEPIEADDALPVVPDWSALQALDKDELLALAREHQSNIKGDVESMNMPKLRSALNQLRKQLEK